MIDVEILTKVSEKVFSEHLSVLVYSSKALAAIIFLVAASKKFMTQFAKGNDFSAKDADSFSSYDILRTLILLALIGTIPEILMLIDKLFSGILELFVGDFKNNELFALQMKDVPVPEVTQDDSTMNAILKSLMKIQDMFTLGGELTNTMSYIAYGLDVLVFMIYLGKRFFALGVIKVLSPLLIAFSIFPKYKDLTYNIGKVYIRTFLTIIPMLLVVAFANEFYAMFIEYMTGDASKTAIMLAAGDVVRTIAICGVVWLKFSLFKQSSEIMKSLWP